MGVPDGAVHKRAVVVSQRVSAWHMACKRCQVSAGMDPRQSNVEDAMSHQERCAESAIRAAEKCVAAGNPANAAHFWRLAATHLEMAARMVPCRRGVPIDVGARTRITFRYRAVLDHIMADARAVAS